MDVRYHKPADWRSIKGSIRRVANSQRNRRGRQALKTNDGSITFEYLWALFHRQNYKCAICKTNDLREVPRDLDHIVPLMNYGPHRSYNVQWVCRYCNRVKNVMGYDRSYCRLKYNPYDTTPDTTTRVLDPDY